MKKNTLLLVLLIACCWQSNAQFTESFETEIPATWTILDEASSSSWVWDDSPSGDGAQDGLAIASIGSSSDSANDDYLITPPITVSAGLNDRLSFYVRSRSGGFLESYEVLLSTTTATAVDFSTVLQAESEAPGEWTKLTFDLTPYIGQSVYVAVRAKSYSEWELYVDNFVNDTFPACREPLDFAVTNISNTTAGLEWTEDGTATSWSIEIVDVTAGEAVTGVATLTAVTNPYTVTGLTPNNDYEFYVQADCGVDGSSIWVGPASVTTACDAFIAPYLENFDNAGAIPNCWSVSSDSGEEDWSFSDSGPSHVGTDGTISGSTLSNGYYAACDASSDHGPRYLLSPFVDVSTLTSPELRFYEVSDAEDSDNAQLDVEVWDGAAWNLMATYNTNTIGWELKIIDISGLTFTGAAQARFTFSEPLGGGDDDIAIDDVTFDNTIACPTPTALNIINISNTTADLTWTENGTATSWNIEIVDITAGGSVTGTATTTGVSNPYMLTGLLPNNEYGFYVQADCGVTNGTSFWLGPMLFTTNCDAFTAPYTEGFDNGGAIPDCWSMSSDSGEEEWFFETSGLGHVGDGGTITGSTSSNGYYAACDASGDHGPRYLVSPLVDVSTLATPVLSFYELSNSENSENAQLDVEVWDGATWNLLATYNTDTLGWQLKIIDISGLTFTGAAQARFTFSEVIAPGDFDDDLAIDDVTFEEAPACIPPTTLAATNITTTTADLSWVSNAASWNLEVIDITAGETATGVATITGVLSPYNLTGLTDDNNYEFYVQTDCGVDGASMWVGPYPFATTIIPPSCGGNFLDTGGSTGFYSSSEFTTTTILPDAAGDAVTITFSFVDLEADDLDPGEQGGCYDYLTIYNGPDNTYPVLAQTLCGQESGDGTMPSVSASELHVGDAYTSTDASGALTIEFSSDGGIEYGGWEASITCSALSIDDVVNEIPFTYYPNPVKNKLTLNAKQTIENVDVFNMLGQQVLHAKPNTVASELDLSALQTGPYFVKVTIGNSIKTIRVIKH